jgi:hypothetical protein
VTLTRAGKLGEDGLSGNLIAFSGVNVPDWSELRLVTINYKGGVSYLGKQVNTPHGQFGAYERNDNRRDSDKCMVTLSSSLAHIARGEWLPYVSTGDWKATRLDMQITVEGTFNPVTLAGLLHKKRSVKMQSSYDTLHDGDTVYIGSSNSDRFGVVYEKLEGKHVRLELRHKGEYAERAAITMALRNNTTHEDIIADTIGNWIRMLPSREAADGLSRKFDIGQNRSKLEYIIDGRESERRAKWLLQVAWPAIQRTIRAGEYPASTLVHNMYDLLEEVIGDVGK